MIHWYALYTKPKSENKVASWLSQREIEVYLPELKIPPLSLDHSVTKELLFPCYIFVKFSLEEECISSIKWLPGVRKFVSFDGNPAPIPNYIIDAIRQNIEFAEEMRGKDSQNAIPPGTQVRIISGPFQGMHAIFDRSTSSAHRVQILLEILGSLNRVKININDLKVISDKQATNGLAFARKRPRRTRGRCRYIKSKN